MHSFDWFGESSVYYMKEVVYYLHNVTLI